MKEKIAYLRGLMDGMKLADDDNGKLLRAIADCLDAIADEVEVESARTDVIEEQIDIIGEEVDDLDEIIDELLDDEDEDDEDDYEYDYEDDFEDEDDELFPIPERRGHGPRHGHCGHGPHPHGGHCCHHHEFIDDDEDFDGEAFLDSLNFFTCPNCGEIVPIDDDMLKAESDPICPRCNSHIFGADKPEETGEDKE